MRTTGTMHRETDSVDVNVVDAPPHIELQAWFRRSDGRTEPSSEIWMLDPDSVEELVRELLAARENAMALSAMDPDRGDDLDEDLAFFEHLASLANEPGD